MSRLQEALALPGFGSLSVASLDASLCQSDLKRHRFHLGSWPLAEEATLPVGILLGTL